MPTKLSRYCSGVMEVAWLAAVSLIPIFFNVYSSRIFEPDKISILRSIALIILAAWIIKLIAEGGISWNERSQNESFFNYLFHYPMIAPVTGLVFIYIISTIFSVTPSISLLGSYQRLQGTYTTFSYIIIFASIIANLRTSDQINRLITTVIISSLPVTLYGLLQHYQIDPIPWGGNVSIRIASNMGNSIFVAAYLIMVFPLTVGRIIGAFKEILKENDTESGNRTFKQITKATIYIFIAALELIAIYFSKSRGPLLGLLAGSYLLILLLSIYWRKRWLSIVIVSLALLGAGFLAIFNINNGPLEALKKSPYIGRFGLLLDPESNSALVRQYIWEGTVKLVGIHDPIKFPDGSSDKFNFIRPLIGYGPESMYVAYNQFYQPQLGQVEKRNASPDRSHNETWDSIVITGFAGLLVYLSIFGSVFYYGLKWLGLLNGGRNKYFFFLCLVGGGVIGAVALVLVKGIEFFGVGLPFGMILGMVIYLTLYALFSPIREDVKRPNSLFNVLLITIFAAIVGHFVEINFGIAIVATRTLFWTYTGILVVAGFALPTLKEFTSLNQNFIASSDNKNVSADRVKIKKASIRQKRKDNRNLPPLIGDHPAWFRNALITGIITGIILVTLGFNYVTNAGHTTSFIKIILNSFTRLPNHDNSISFGVLILIFTTWVISLLLFSSENEEKLENNVWIQEIGISAIISLSIFLLFVSLHAISLSILAGFAPQTQNDVITQLNSIDSLLTKYYIYLFLIILFAGFVFPEEWPQRRKLNVVFSWISVPVIFIILFVMVNISNLKVIHADITFKMAEPYTKGNQWQVATFLYKRALELAPREDHYYLFLGRSYIEQAKITDSQSDQDQLVEQAESDLKKAQSINPLNTDHTANLARLYSWWAGKATDIETRNIRAQKSSDYYSTAVTLSPNNSTIWDEWASLYLQLLGQPQEAYQKLQHALKLDNRYSLTNGLLGDYYMKMASSSKNDNTKINALYSAAEYYQKAAEVTKVLDGTPKVNYLVSLGNVYINLAGLQPTAENRNQIQQGINNLLELSKSGVSVSDLWKVQITIAKIYLQLGDKQQAKYYATQALENAPNTVIDQINNLLSQIDALP